MLEPQKLYRGTVTAAPQNAHSYDVLLEEEGVELFNCRTALGLLLPGLGFKTRFRIPVGTKVLVMAGNPATIMATESLDFPDTAAGLGRSLTDTDVSADPELDDEARTYYAGPTLGVDLLPGEVDMGNSLGLMLQFLTTIVKLGASERAKIEMSIFDDLVRVVSGTYQHYSAFGDFEISNQGGGPTIVFEGTSKTHEARGIVDPGEASATAEDEKIRAVAEEGRWRVKGYFGYLGDLLHLLVTEPEETIGQLGQPKAGKLDFHIGTDGAVGLRSVRRISCEIVRAIPVPVALVPSGDPEGDTLEDVEAMVRESGGVLDTLLQRWDYGRSNDRIWELPYQLRQYSRFLSQLHAYARILAQKKNFSIPSEAESPQADWNNKEDDVARANPGTASFPIFSGWYMLDDGSYVVLSGYGHAVVMDNRGVKVSSTKHMEYEAAGNMVFSADNIHMVARSNIEMTAVYGALQSRSRTAWKALCTEGMMHLKSDSPDPADPEFESLKLEDPFEGAPKPEYGDQSLLLEAAIGSATVRSSRRVSAVSTGQHVRDSEVENADSTAGSVVLQSLRQDMVSIAGRNTQMVSNGSDAHGVFAMKSRVLAIHATESMAIKYGEMLDINRQMTFRPGAISATVINAKNLTGTRGIWGPRKTPTGESKVASHLNHINLLDGEEEKHAVSLATTDELSEAKVALGRKLDEVKLFKGAAPVWDHFPPTVYTPVETTKEASWRSLSQERLQEDEDMQEGYDEWDWADNGIRSADAARSGKLHKHPWPGKNPKHVTVASSEPLLHHLSETPPDELPKSGEVPELTPKIQRYYKPN